MSVCKEEKRQARDCKGPHNPEHDGQGSEAISQINS